MIEKLVCRASPFKITTSPMAFRIYLLIAPVFCKKSRFYAICNFLHFLLATNILGCVSKRGVVEGKRIKAKGRSPLLMVDGRWCSTTRDGALFQANLPIPG
jgi:hypothetical protein